MTFREFLIWLLFPDGAPGQADSLSIQNYLDQFISNISVKSGTIPLGIARITRGQYGGTGAQQSIACGFAPQQVIIQTDNSAGGGVTFGYPQPGTGVVLTATGFDVSVGGGTFQNVIGRTYGWIAIGGAV